MKTCGHHPELNPYLDLSEHKEQVIIFKWAELTALSVPELEWLYAIPNGLRAAGIGAAKKAKAEGLKSGVPDICLPVPKGKWHGLYLEIKRLSLRPKTSRSKGGVSDAQDEWHVRLRRQGYAVAVCYGADDAIVTIMRYLDGCFSPKDYSRVGYGGKDESTRHPTKRQL